MIKVIEPNLTNYHLSVKVIDNALVIGDHLSGFDKNLNSEVLNVVVNQAKTQKIKNIYTAYVFSNELKKKYNFQNLKYKEYLVGGHGWEEMREYRMHPFINYRNFVCSFNGTGHVSRQLLSSILNNQGFFNREYSSKNFSHNNNRITSHLKNLDLNDNDIRVYSKFFLNLEEFNNTIYSFGHVQYDHGNNIYNLENKLTQSFLHIVSETMATSYYPFVTEKFLYSIVTRGLFLAYAQPNWHTHLNEYYGFKLYDTIFDYSFDNVQNPVKRLIKLIEMVSKFSTLSTNDWRDLYHLEQDNIEYNYDHYFSGAYKKHLAQFG